MTEALMIVLKLAIVVVAVGAVMSWTDLAHLWRRPGLLARSLVAMYVLVPLVAFLLVQLLPIGPGPKAALLVLAVSAGAPMLPKKLKTIGQQQHVFSLLVISSLMAIVIVPLWVSLLSDYFNVVVDLPVGKVALAVGKAILAPLVVGMVIHLVVPHLAERLSGPVITVAGFVLLAAGLVLVAVHWNVLLAIRWPGVAALGLMLMAALVIGQLSGGADADDSTVLAIACATRHIGIALVVASQFAKVSTLILIVAYVFTAALVSGLYLSWRRRAALPAVQSPS